MLAAVLIPSLVAAYFAYRLYATRSGPSGNPAPRHDGLTDLPNRSAVEHAAERAIEECRQKGGEFAVIVVNIDRLKTINDSLGHQAGDELLREVSRRLRRVLKRNDVLVRLAGDEFTVLAHDLRGTRDAEAIVSRLAATVRDVITIGESDVHATLSMGISVFPVDGSTFPILLRHADVAMRVAKSASRGSYRFYSHDMSQSADDRLTLENELRRAIQLGQMELHYQPKVDISTNRVRSAEALIRWRHPTRGMVAPNTFIPMAEETGLIVEIGEWVLRKACLQVRRWLDGGMAPVRVAVNLSAKQFRHADLAAVVRSALSDARLEPGYLELELTESAVMDDAEKSAATLQLLSTMGVHISIDDFGTGYSSLSYLRRFPLDKLKIDRSFVRDLIDESGRCVHRQGNHLPGAQPAPARRGRRRGDGRAARVPARARLRSVPGLLLQPGRSARRLRVAAAEVAIGAPGVH